MSYRVLICDDHPIVRRGLRGSLQGMDGVEVCGEASNGIEALEEVKRTSPELVLLDLVLPDIDGMEVLRRIRSEAPGTDVLVVSMYDSKDYASRALLLGARGYLLKTVAGKELVSAIECIREGRLFFCHSSDGGDSTAPKRPTQKVEQRQTLSHREAQILKFIANGKTNRQTASILNISHRTVEEHRKRIMQKLELHSVADLVRYVINHPLVSCS